MPLVLSPSFDEKTRAEVEAHLDWVRIHRLAAALQYHQSQQQKFAIDGTRLGDRLNRAYVQLGGALRRLDRDMEMVTKHLETCTTLQQELGIVYDKLKA
jgi:hypothetical protein